MSRTLATIVLRAIGTLSGLLGVWMFCVTPFLLAHGPIDTVLWMLRLILFPLAVAAYSVYVGYLVCFRFSPQAVRHVCGLLPCYLPALFTPLFDPKRDLGTPWAPFAFLAVFVVVHFACRALSFRLSRWLFHESDAGVESCVRHNMHSPSPA